jgi:RsiW-degrading membrane proteinase PrsW (M82 family)
VPTGVPGVPDDGTAVYRTLVWLVAAGVVACLALLAGAVVGHGRRRARLTWLAAGALLLPFTLPALDVLVTHPRFVLVCLPSTLYAGWLLQRAQRFTPLPPAVLWSAVAWGALVATGIAGATNVLAIDTSMAWRARDARIDVNPLELLEIRHDVQHLLAFHAGVVEELAKGVGVLLVLLLFRRRLVRDVVGGIAVGTFVGLGFNLAETVSYQAMGDAAFQYWARQSVGLFAAHVAFTAMTGAGLGATLSLADRRVRLLTVGAGLGAAGGAHVASDTLPGWFGHLTADHVQVGGVLDTVVVAPLSLLAVQGPFVVLYALLLRSGNRARDAAFRTALTAEAADGHGAVLAREIPLLTHPAARFWVTATAARRYGLGTARALRRTHAAQLELARRRWQLDDAEGAAEIHRQRQVVLALKSPSGYAPAVEVAPAVTP